MRYGRKKNSHSTVDKPFWISVGIVGLSFIPQLVMGLGYNVLPHSWLQQNASAFLLISFLVPVTLVFIILYKSRNIPNTYFYVIRHFSKGAWIILSIGAIFVLLLYIRAQCYSFGLPYGLECVIKTFGR